MNIRLRTKVDGNYKAVMQRFDLELFEALKPKIGKMEVVKFTGSKKGDVVHIRFLSPVKAEWVSDIVEDRITETEAYFIDEGTTLPFPLKYWRHKHIVEKIDETSSYIVDDMTFRGPNILITLLIYPVMYLSFYPRKSIYQRYFKA